MGITRENGPTGELASAYPGTEHAFQEFDNFYHIIRREHKRHGQTYHLDNNYAETNLKPLILYLEAVRDYWKGRLSNKGTLKVPQQMHYYMAYAAVLGNLEHIEEFRIDRKELDETLKKAFDDWEKFLGFWKAKDGEEFALALDKLDQAGLSKR